MTIKAIETVYRGHRFRSRLEARWAVFFDALGIQWQYEPEGFEIAHAGATRRYLPDFYLPKEDVWVEVKGDDSRIDWAMLGVACDGFAEAGLPISSRAYGGSDQGSAILVLGDIPPDGQAMWLHPLIVNMKGVYCHWHFWADPVSGNSLYDASWVGDAGYFDATWAGFDGTWMWHESQPGVSGISERSGFQRMAAVRRAYTTARMARFEHGETGATFVNDPSAVARALRELNRA